MAWKLYEGDCLEVIPSIPEDSVDLVILDPPYNIGKDTWDKFNSHEEYLDFIKSVVCECERVLKDNGSLYIWHNDFQVLSDIQQLIKSDSGFIFKQLIVWNKWYDDVKNKGLYGHCVGGNGLRNYKKLAEYLLFYTFQDETGLTTVKLDLNNFTTLREYFRDFQEALGLSLPQINKILGHRRAEHGFYWKSTQWDLPMENTYQELLKLPLKDKYFKPREYEDLRREYEDLRYTFNNLNTHSSVWDYEIPVNINHSTPKPIRLSENIIKHSSNESDTVLIPFAGSGSEMIASVKNNRNVIGIEIDPGYCSHIRKELKELESQPTLTDF